MKLYVPLLENWKNDSHKSFNKVLGILFRSAVIIRSETVKKIFWNAQFSGFLDGVDDQRFLYKYYLGHFSQYF